jgi:glutaredoxin
MNMWKIYTGDRCSYCTNAKRILNRDEHIGGYNELVEYMKKTLWLDKKKTSKPALPPTLDDIGANSE